MPIPNATVATTHYKTGATCWVFWNEYQDYAWINAYTLSDNFMLQTQKFSPNYNGFKLTLDLHSTVALSDFGQRTSIWL